jgi:hypothetical protein
MPRGDKVIKRLSVFLKTIASLKEQQWSDIFKVALLFATGKQAVLSKKDEPVLSETESDDGEELIDPRYASIPVTEENPE